MSRPAYFRPTLEQVKAARDRSRGWCAGCAHEHTEIERDAVYRHCEKCGAHLVFGPDEFVIRKWVLE